MKSMGPGALVLVVGLAVYSSEIHAATDCNSDVVDVDAVTGLVEISTSLRVSDLSVKGEATFASPISGDTSFDGGLSVGGLLSATNGLTCTGDALVSGQLTVNGSGLFRTDLEVDGIAKVAKTLTVGPPWTPPADVDPLVYQGAIFAQSAFLARNLDVTESGFVGGNLHVAGNSFVTGDASTIGAAQFGSSVTIDGSTSIAAGLSVAGPAQVDASLAVGGDASVGGLLTVGNLSLQQALETTGDATVGGILSVTGDARFQSGLSIDGSASAAAELSIGVPMSISGDLTSSGTWSVSGVAGFHSGLAIDGSASADAELSVGIPTSISGELTVTSPAQFSNTVFFPGGTLAAASGDFIVGQELSAGSVRSSGLLSVSGVAELHSGLSIDGSADAELSVGVPATLSKVVTIMDRLAIGASAAAKKLSVRSAEPIVALFQGDDLDETLLDVRAMGSVTADAGIRLIQASTLRWQVGFDGTDNDKFKIATGHQFNQTRLTIDRDTGHVGIGTSSPGADLHVRSPQSAQLRLEAGAAQSAVLSLTADTEWQLANRSGEPGAPFVLRDQTTGTDVVRVESGVSGTAINIGADGRVSIGTTNPFPNASLSVAGAVQATEIIVESGGADFVFEPGYRLPPLEETERFIQEHGHLPYVPSASTIQEQGVSLGKMQAGQLQLMEELTLHLLAMKRRSDELERKNRDLEKRLEALESLVPGADRSVARSRSGRER